MLSKILIICYFIFIFENIYLNFIIYYNLCFTPFFSLIFHDNSMSFKIFLLFGWSLIIFKTSWTFSYLCLNLLLYWAFSNRFLFLISMMSSRFISASNNLIRCLRQFHIFKDRRFYISFALSYFYENHTQTLFWEQNLDRNLDISSKL